MAASTHNSDPGLLNLRETAPSPMARLQAEGELFQTSFVRWRVALGAAASLSLLVGLIFYFLAGSTYLVAWIVLQVGAYGVQALACLRYERSPPAIATPEFSHWISVWSMLTALTGLISGSLLWFLPADNQGLLLSATAISATFAIGEVSAAGHARLAIAAVVSQALMACLALAFHAHLPLGVVLCVAYSGLLLHFGLELNRSMLKNIEQRLHAEQLAREIEAGQRRLLEAEHQQSVLRERQRVMQDMHDGLGSALSSALVVLDRGSLSVPQAAEIMRECVDDLRLIVDSLEPTSKDVTTLLGMLRYRLQSRISATGVQLHWKMVDLPLLPWLEPSLALDLLRLIQEAIANALRHAGATELELGARLAGQDIEIVVRDNGKGFDTGTVVNAGRGMRTMQTRAKRLGAQLMVHSMPNLGTVVSLLLPTRRATGG